MFLELFKIYKLRVLFKVLAFGVCNFLWFGLGFGFLRFGLVLGLILCNDMV